MSRSEDSTHDLDSDPALHTRPHNYIYTKYGWIYGIGNSTKELTLPSLSDTVSAFGFRLGLAVSLPSQQPSIVPGRRARRLVIVEQLF